jgi:DNA polymerase-3 subunit delta
MSKLRIDQLSRHLQEGLAPAYLISGDETLLVEESADEIRRSAFKSGYTERERYFVDSKFDWSQLLSASNNLSLFSEKKIIELRLDKSKPGDKGSKAICEYLSNANADNCLVIISPKLDASTGRSKWVKALEMQGQWLTIWPISRAQLPGWLEQRIKKLGLNADSNSIELLATRIEGNLLAAHQELEKLKLLSIDGYLTPELIAGAVADSARYDVFGLIDKILLGNAREAVKNLQGLKIEGTEPTVILWAIAREIRILLAVMNSLEQGQNFNWAAKQAGIWEKRQGLAQQALRRLNTRQLHRLLRQANTIDKSIKGLHSMKPWDGLLDMVLNFTSTQCLSEKNLKLSLQT